MLKQGGNLNLKSLPRRRSSTNKSTETNPSDNPKVAIIRQIEWFLRCKMDSPALRSEIVNLLARLRKLLN
jgi:hypothetical protein